MAEPHLTRLYHGLCNARILVCALLAGLQVLAWYGRAEGTGVHLLIAPAVFTLLYSSAALVLRFSQPPTQITRHFGQTWFNQCGLDIVIITLMQVLPQNLGVNYLTLFALPALAAAILCQLRLAFATAGIIALVLLGEAGHWAMGFQGDLSGRYVQAGLIGAAYFLVVFLVNQIAVRLERETHSAQLHEAQTALEATVNRLVMAHLSLGVVVVQSDGVIRAVNPSAATLLSLPKANTSTLDGASLDMPYTHPLWALAQQGFAMQAPQIKALALGEPNPRQLRVQVHVTAVDKIAAQPVAVLFLEDQREVDAQIRVEKMAAMGRVSAAMAHEIRNPLAAISNANQLLSEGLQDPANQRLSRIVMQNAQRLDKIVKDVLSVAHTQADGMGGAAAGKSVGAGADVLTLESTSFAGLLPLDETVRSMVTEWQANQRDASLGAVLLLAFSAKDQFVRFDADHLRQILLNLLDNAWRHVRDPLPAPALGADAAVQAARGCLVVQTQADAMGVRLSVWNTGAALDAGVLAHLFEPFFSSQARSSGLGLYISQALCQQHGANLRYSRDHFKDHIGNRFTLQFAAAP